MIDIIKGMLIGIANVIPGLSGGTIAVSVGIYDKLIHAINNIKTDFKGSIKAIWKYGVGMVLGILFSVLIVVKLFEILPFPTTMLFIGLILGSLPIIFKNVKGKKINALDITLFITMMAVIVILPNLSAGVAKEFTFTVGGIAILFIIGVIASGTMIIPGVSGSMMLMIMGYYETLTTLISDTIKAALALDIATCVQNGLLLVPFTIGVVVGIVALAKLIEYLLNKCRKTVFWAILGLLLASPYGILVKIESPINFTPVTVLLSIAFFAIGTLVTIKLGETDEELEKEEKKSKKKSKSKAKKK